MIYFSLLIFCFLSVCLQFAKALSGDPLSSRKPDECGTRQHVSKNGIVGQFNIFPRKRARYVCGLKHQNPGTARQKYKRKA